MIELIKHTKINFMAARKYAFTISGLLAILGIIGMIQVYRGQANLGIDFAGGTEVQIKFEQAVSVHEVRAVLETAGLKDLDIQDLPSVNKVLIRVKKAEDDQGADSKKIINAVMLAFPSKNPVVDSTTEIGPKVGDRLKKDALFAIVASTIGLLIYIAFRFQFRFSIGATIATFHDVLAVFGIFYLLGYKIDLIFISALLMIAGYSLTDTVVVFDRIRENLKRGYKEGIEALINRSVNEVLSRTIIVSLTTLLSALALFIFGGEVLHDFSLAIIMGILVGTYSSVFIASPVLLIWKGPKPLGK